MLLQYFFDDFKYLKQKIKKQNYIDYINYIIAVNKCYICRAFARLDSSS